jgi:putative hydrolase of the HAD superfamily
MRVLPWKSFSAWFIQSELRGSPAAGLQRPLGFSGMRAVLFDLDCTLTDRNASIREVAGCFLRTFRSRLGPIRDEELFAALQRADGNGYRARHEMCLDLVACLPWLNQPSADEIDHFWWRELPLCTVAPEGLHELLDGLVKAGIDLGVVSNGRASVQYRKIDALGIRPNMKAIVISEEAGVAKPSPEIFIQALNLLGSPPSEALFVGDNPVADILGAQSAGIRAVWLRNGRTWQEEHLRPAREIDSLLELLTYA